MNLKAKDGERKDTIKKRREGKAIGPDFKEVGEGEKITKKQTIKEETRALITAVHRRCKSAFTSWQINVIIRTPTKFGER